VNEKCCDLKPRSISVHTSRIHIFTGAYKYFKERTFAMHPTAETIIKDESFCDIW